jgi:3-oxoacyl-[acyl-carrier-protein] synthase II
VAEPIAITGIGQVSALGGDVPALAAGVREGRCGIRALTLFPHRGRAAIAAEAPTPAAMTTSLSPAEARRLSRSDRLALSAADEACRMAGLDAPLRADAALAVGTTTAGMLETEEAYRRWRAGEERQVRLSRVVGMPLATVGAAVSQVLGIFGPKTTVSTACSSSALAVVTAAEQVARGDVAVAVVVGVDSLCRLTYAGFDALQALDVDPCRPFDASRRGLSLGEGAGALVLERVDHARARGAAIRAVLLGTAVSADAHHVTAPHPESVGALSAFHGALAAAGVVADAVDYVNAHGSGTKHNDEAEVAALRAVFGRRLARVPVSSSKSQIGHCLAAAGALEAIVTITALDEGVVPATVTFRESDAAWGDMDFVPTPGRRAPLGVAVSSSYGFGGHNVSLVLAHPEARR